ncbi:Oleate hydroxylase FAH12 [Golovinomyces cichoracearum]|uniref:Oleate hydroxylase FAH12 n=1 Tax=Golovinomyces cichoracearum TaxID=62708 RepID=A0A420HF45_9PEZI|nr:Oleate hydroxylase FAH12 [Golovinomyces cichoracearum]
MEKQPHVDLNGKPFELSNFTMKEIYDAIPPHCFKPSTIRSLAYVVRDYLYLSTLVYIAVTYIPLIPYAPLRFLAWTAYTVLQGFVFTGIWILAHECGHGAFSKSKKLNWTLGLILHSFLLVPFHSWRITHSQHHKGTGNLERDTAFVPSLREEWIQAKLGKKARENLVEFAELAEDSPIAALWHDIVHQLFGWPGYLLCNLTGQKYGGAKGLRISHFYFGKDSVFYKENELGLIMLSDVGVAIMIAILFVLGQIFGSWNVCILWGVPWLWVNNWIVAITFLQHTDATMPHYSNNTWNFARGATATIDRDLGFIDTHLFHDIIGTHVCHHLVSTIPFYHAGEASVHIRRVMGQHYKSDTKTPFWTAFWRNQRTCKFVEESKGCEGSGVYMFRNLHSSPSQNESIKQADQQQDKVESKDDPKCTLASSINRDARRRLSQSAQLRANLPLLAE